ncbi:hypothetical protein [Thauera sp.]|uniref:hypothetical protein n=1 Tax=Thauera sp. TaxID=1905334 RepID=UPI002BF19906|nr:hypothetical protein [Thauera sp.]HRP25989.1 hypothetical protein [Thauera sp.]
MPACSTLARPQDAIERVIDRHRVVRRLIDNGWLHLWRFEGPALRQYAGGGWQPVACGQA